MMKSRERFGYAIETKSPSSDGFKFNMFKVCLGLNEG
jgi:hypothetical protein